MDISIQIITIETPIFYLLQDGYIYIYMKIPWTSREQTWRFNAETKLDWIGKVLLTG